MNTLKAINSRRSIRKFKSKPISKKIVSEILKLTILAPSPKNRQPWFFVVLINNKKKKEMLMVIKEKISQLKRHGEYIGSLEKSIECVQQAPLVILVFGRDTRGGAGINSFDIQSIGGAIQTMLLAATDLELGSLWIGDIFFVKKEISDWLKQQIKFQKQDELLAAVALGYADESPPPRSRKPLKEVVKWL